MTKNMKNACIGAMLALQLLFCFFPAILHSSRGGYSCNVIIETCTDIKNDSDLRYESEEVAIKDQCTALSAINILIMADAVVTLAVFGMFCQNAGYSGVFMLLSSVMLGILPFINMSLFSTLYDTMGRYGEFSITGIGIVQIMLAVVAVFVGMIPATEVNGSPPSYISRNDENSEMNRFFNNKKDLD